MVFGHELTENRSLFFELDESSISKVKFRDDTTIDTKDMRKKFIRIKDDRPTYIANVFICLNWKIICWA